MPATTDGFQIAPDEFASWIVHEDARVLVVNKPALVVCHPSKDGPRSSLVGAARLYAGLSRVHLVFRLDRETSGVVVLAKERDAARQLQMAVEQRRVRKRYLAILQGEYAGAQVVDVPIGPDLGSVVALKRRAAATPEARAAQTWFRAVVHGGGFTIVEASPVTGRTHQIRAHAEWLGHRVVGDKIYGPSPMCFLEFLENGWSPALAQRLLLDRQALHCAEVEFLLPGGPCRFAAPPTRDLVAFARERMDVDLLAVARAAAARPAPAGFDCAGA